MKRTLRGLARVSQVSTTFFWSLCLRACAFFGRCLPRGVRRVRSVHRLSDESLYEPVEELSPARGRRKDIALLPMVIAIMSMLAALSNQRSAATPGTSQDTDLIANCRLAIGVLANRINLERVH